MPVAGPRRSSVAKPDTVRHRCVEANPVRSRAKQKTSEKPASPRKATIAKLVQPPQRDIDDDADDRQRVGVQSLGRAFAILEELSRETSESSHFAVRMGDAVVVIARTSGPGAFQLTDRVGVVRPAHCTACLLYTSPSPRD